MENIIIALEVVLPIFAVIGVGYLLRYLKIIDEHFINIAMKVIFKVSLPGMLFLKVSKSDLNSLLSSDNLWFAVFVSCAIFSVFFLARIVANLWIKDNKGKGAFAQGAFRSNYVIIGYSILYSMFGDAIIGKMALLVIVVVPLYNILSIWVLSIYGNEENQTQFKDILLNIGKNPLIIGIILGFLVAFFGIPIERLTIIDSTISTLGSIGTPLGLIGIGAFFTLEELKSIKTSLLAVALKIVVFPILITSAAYFLGFAYLDIMIIYVLFGAPTAISSFVMATAMESDGQLAANIIILSTAGSLITLIAGLSVIGFIFGG